jgi:hypothetical protein
MKPCFGPFLIMLVVLSVSLAWSQTSTSDTSPSGYPRSLSQGVGSPQQSAGPSQESTGSSQQPSDGPQPAFTYPEERPQLAFLDEVTAHSFLTLGLGASTAWDSNAGSFSYQPYSLTYFIVTPSIQIKQTRPTFVWYAGAFGALTTSNSSRYYSTSNPSANAGFLWQINKHWQFSVNNNYLYTADPFQQYLVYSGTPSFNQPNPTIYTPLATVQSNYATATLTYQINARDTLVFGGSASVRRYLHTTSTVYDLTTYGGYTAYQHQFSAKFLMGGSYSFNALDSSHGQSRSGVNMFQVFADYQLGPHMTVSGWVGPQYTTTKNLIPILCTPYGCFIEEKHFNSWAPAFGGSFSWRGDRNAFTAGFMRTISDGGLVLGVVQLYQVNSSYLRRLGSRWTANLGMLYGNNTGTSTQLQAQHLDSLTASANLTRQLTPALSAGVQYLYINENQKNIIGAAAPHWTDNRVQISLQYYWGHSLGR